MVTRPSSNARLIVEVNRNKPGAGHRSIPLDQMTRNLDLFDPGREILQSRGLDVYIAVLSKEDLSSEEGLTRNPEAVGARLTHLAKTFEEAGRYPDIVKFEQDELGDLRSQGDLVGADNPTVCALVKMSGESCHVETVLQKAKDPGQAKLGKLRTPRPYVMLELLAHLSGGPIEKLNMPDVHWVLLASQVMGKYPVLQLSGKPNIPSSFHYCDGEIGKHSLRGPGLVVFATSVS